MTARAIQFAFPWYDDLTPFDRALYQAIVAHADPETRVANNLFDIVVRRAGLHYPYSLDRLEVLSLRSYIRVLERTPGKPMAIQVLSGDARGRQNARRQSN